MIVTIGDTVEMVIRTVSETVIEGPLTVDTGILLVRVPVAELVCNEILI